MLAEFVGFLCLVVRPVISQLQEVEVVFISVLDHLVVKHVVGHEHIAPKLGSGSFVALWHVKDLFDGGLKVRTPHSARVDGHGDFHNNFVLIDACACLPSVFAQIGEER